jgi:hypothetical protein
VDEIIVIGAGVGAFYAWYYGDEIAAGAGDVCDRLQEALRNFRENNRFRRWWHRTYGDEKIGDGTTENPDLPVEDILEGWEEWNDLGQPEPPGK